MTSTITDPAVPSPLTRDVISWAQGQGAETLEEASELFDNVDAEDVLGIESGEAAEVESDLERLVSLLGGDLALDDLL